MLKGFRDFLMRGNVIDLAVAVVIGVAFGAVVAAFATDFIGGIIGAIGGHAGLQRRRRDRQRLEDRLWLDDQRADQLRDRRGGGLLRRRRCPMQRDREAPREDTPRPAVRRGRVLLTEIRDLLAPRRAPGGRSSAGSTRPPAASRRARRSRRRRRRRGRPRPRSRTCCGTSAPWRDRRAPGRRARARCVSPSPNVNSIVAAVDEVELLLALVQVAPGRVARRQHDRVDAERRDAELLADLAEARALAHPVEAADGPAVARGGLRHGRPY